MPVRTSPSSGHATFCIKGDMQPRLEECALLDTGAAGHVFNDKRMFTELSNIENRFVMVGGGEKLLVRGSGKVFLHEQHGSYYLIPVVVTTTSRIPTKSNSNNVKM
jgi:hypothetical protein